MLKENYLNITKRDLLRKGTISVNTFNACGNAGFRTLRDIIVYYMKNRGFQNNPNIKRKAAEELSACCLQAIEEFNIEDGTQVVLSMREIQVQESNPLLSSSLEDSKPINSLGVLNSEYNEEEKWTDLLYNSSLIIDEEVQNVQKQQILSHKINSQEYFNLTTDDLLGNRLLTVRAYNTCTTAELFIVRDIINYYINGNKFDHIRNAGKKTAEELMLFCTQTIEQYDITEKYEHQISDNKVQELDGKNYSDNEKYLNLTKEFLLKNDLLTVRAFNTCGNAELYTIKDIVDYYLKGNKFLDIRNAGKKTAEELTSFCEEIIEKFNVVLVTQQQFSPNELSGQKLFAKYNSFNEKQKEYLELFYNESIYLLDNRSKNALSVQCPSLSDFLDILSFNSNSRSPFRYLRNIGINSEQILIQFRSKIEEKINEVENYSDSEITIHLFRIKFKLPENILDSITFFYSANHYIPNFYILQKILERDLIQNQRDTTIFVSSFNVFENHKIKSRDEIANELSISVERIRQLRSSIFENFFSYKNNLFSNASDWDHYHYIDEELILNINSREILNKIQLCENSNLSKLFILKVLSFVFPSKFKIYGDLDFLDSERSKCEWKSVYLIKSEYADIFDFELFRNEFWNFILLPYYEDYTFDFNDYLNKCLCWISVDFEYFELIKKITLEIILEEFGLYCDFDQKITIKAQTKEHPTEVVYNIIKKNGAPMHIDAIFREFKKIIPEKYDSSDKLRPTIAANEKITFINRSSIYTLIEWSHIKSGTIRDAIVELLISREFPMKICDIAHEILKVFPNSNESSIRTSILSDTKNRFQLVSLGVLGLANREYSTELPLFPTNPISSKQERLLKFQKFSNPQKSFHNKGQNESISNNNCQEASLGSKNIIPNLFSNSQINEDLKYHLENSLAEWYIYYDKICKFISANKRLPLISEDKILYSWIIKLTNQLKDNKLNEDQRKKVILLSKLL